MSTGTVTRSLEILLVEDNPADAAMTRLGFEAANIACTMHVAGNGFEAMSFLLQTARFREAPRPDLVILDLNLPKKGGRDVLARIKGDPSFETIPVAVLTGSESVRDIAAACDVHANCYLTKPTRLRDYTTLARLLKNLWLNEAEPRIVE
jgi:two-component system, chemotaxis family, response regulator Rcp1